MVEKGRGLVMVAGPSSYWLKGGGLDGRGKVLVIVVCFKVCILKNRAIYRQNGTDGITQTDTLNA